MIAEAVTVIGSALAALFALLTWKNQVWVKINIEAEQMVLNDDPYCEFDSVKKGNLCISNIGYKAITITDVILCVEEQELSINTTKTHNEKVNELLNPGEVKYFPVDRDMIISFVRNNSFKKSSPIIWKIKTSTGKTFKAEPKNIVSDVILPEEELF